MSEHTGNIYVFGAVSRDVFAPEGDVSPGHVPGAKLPWQPEVHDDRLQQLLDNGAEWHLGGNAMNVAARLATDSSLEGAAFVGVLGDDEISNLARQHMGVMRVSNQSAVAYGYQPSVSIIENMPGGDRMTIGRRRDPMDPHLTDEHIAKTTEGASLVVATSLKTGELAQRVFWYTPGDAFKAYTPGSTEIREQPDQVWEFLYNAKPDLLAVNEEELRKITGAPDRADTRDIVRQTTLFTARNTLCTLGEDGMMLARRLRNGRVEQIIHRVTPVPAEQIKNTVGAGDRALAIGALGLAQERPVKEIFAQIASETAQVVQHLGAHQDLYPLRYPGLQPQAS